ncbi:predicted protein [Sclerotinia sclerotiorum 1980 UF-70]|uniref:Uncharacterized protein n=1 Tax=Sclerotinia sclerotiorum (strain ATCC 18683 / 1980 / Ss-1) TaxID=665079 RepID=A7ER64_SCLS1|nr:predicted protein [Sclerotinia sclerotiorum 1980 UF-70]EDN91956.1 predicted protein [Sclerotinia sclerotiorum 1980 UF-70]
MTTNLLNRSHHFTTVLLLSLVGIVPEYSHEPPFFYKAAYVLCVPVMVLICIFVVCLCFTNGFLIHYHH